MAEGIEIFKRVTLEPNPERAVEKLESKDLAELIQELERKRWRRSMIAGLLLDRAIDTAVSRFVVETYLTT